MNSTLYFLFYFTVAWIFFGILYENTVQQYFHTKIKYRLFALRDSLRTLRADHPEIEARLFSTMELRINGCIGLVREISLHRLFFAILAEAHLDEENKRSVEEINETARWIRDNKETEIGKRLFEIERIMNKAFGDSIRVNTPIVLFVLFPLVGFCVRYWPKIANRYKKTKDGIMEGTVPAMMVHAAR